MAQGEIKMNKLLDQLAEARAQNDETMVRLILNQIAYINEPEITEQHFVMFGTPMTGRSFYVKKELTPKG